MKRILCFLLSWMLLFSLSIAAIPAYATEIEGEITPTEPVTEPATEPETEPATEPATEPVTEPVTEPITEPETEPETDPSIVTGSCGAASWKIDRNSYTITVSGNGEMGPLTYAEVKNYSRKIKRIVVENGITSLPERAFEWFVYATSVSLPTSLRTIGERAFAGCGRITEIKIPNSVTYLGNYAFRSCHGLTSFVMPDSVTSIGYCVFEDCVYLTSIKLSNNLTVIPGFTFDNCYNLKSITIPASVREVKNKPFDEITTITFLGNAPTFDSKAFEGINGTVIYPANNSTWTENVRQSYGGEISWVPKGDSGASLSGTFGRNDIFTWKLEGSTLYVTGNGNMRWTEGNNPPWYSYRGMITTVVLSGSMDGIYSNAFKGCTSLTDIVWPSDMKVLYNDCFQGCTALKTVQLPNTVRTVSEGSFQGCTALQNIKLSSDTQILGMSAFSGCTALREVNLPQNLAYHHHPIQRKAIGQRCIQKLYQSANYIL